MSDNSNIQPPIEMIRDSVRLRPGMYFGASGPDALHQLICIAIDYSIDEAVNGTCSRIEIVLSDNQFVTVRDNGLGLPIEADAQTGQPIFQISPLERPGVLKSYQLTFQASRDALGLPVLNAVCSSFNIEVKRNRFLWRQRFAAGQPLSALEMVHELADNDTTGSKITFAPDFSIFDPNEFDSACLSQRLRELAYLVPGLTISLDDKRSNTSNYLEFYSKDGVSDFVKHLNRGYKVLDEPIAIRETVELKKDFKPLGISGTFDIALQYADVYQPIILSYMNGVKVEYGGPHIKGLQDALKLAIFHKAQQSTGWEDFAYHGFNEDDCIGGLAIVLNMQHPNPQTCNSRYYLLSNPELEKAVSALVGDAVEKFAESHPDQMQSIIEKAIANRTLRFERQYGK